VFLESDGRWSKTVEDIKETFDEVKARERYELKGVKDRDALPARIGSTRPDAGT
jgi:hypothetical protein